MIAASESGRGPDVRIGQKAIDELECHKPSVILTVRTNHWQRYGTRELDFFSRTAGETLDRLAMLSLSTGSSTLGTITDCVCPTPRWTGTTSKPYSLPINSIVPVSDWDGFEKSEPKHQV